MIKRETIGIGMIGHAFMGKAHTIGFRDAAVIGLPDLPRPRLIALCGRDATKTNLAGARLGWERVTQDWRDIVSDPEIELVDNVGPNLLHVEPMIAAARAGKHLLCEKPLAPTAATAHDMWKAAEEAGVRHMCGFNYRFFPALQLARRMIQGGELGTIHHYRSNFLLSSSLDGVRVRSWRDDKGQAGSGSLGDLGSHHIDLARFLLDANPARATGVTRLVVTSGEVGEIETDDAFAAILEFDNGALGVLEASRIAGGHLVTSRIEVDGSYGSLQFSLRCLNELRVAGKDRIFRTITALREGDPYQENWFPAGHPLGWAGSFAHEAMHILGAVAGLHPVPPIGATFRDGYFCAEIVDAVLRSALERTGVDIVYKDVAGRPA